MILGLFFLLHSFTLTIITFYSTIELGGILPNNFKGLVFYMVKILKRSNIGKALRLSLEYIVHELYYFSSCLDYFSILFRNLLLFYSLI
jgi:hypothetical protein